MNALEIRNINKNFKNVNVLNNLTFDIEEGAVYGFLGKNGAGKTTTIKIITGLIRPTYKDGSYVNICGRRLAFGDCSINGDIGFLPDVPAFYNYMKPLEYLRLCGGLYGVKQPDLDKRAKQLIEMVGLADANRKIGGFSRGMKQRLGIAQAMIHQPKLLILDEPTSALDPVGRKEILDIIQQLKGQYTVIFSTHILSDVERVCDEIGILNGGEISAGGKIADIRKQYGAKKITVETTEAAHDALSTLLDKFADDGLIANKSSSAPGVFDAAANDADAFSYKICPAVAGANIPLLRLEVAETSLEDVFMEVIQ